MSERIRKSSLVENTTKFRGLMGKVGVHLGKRCSRCGLPETYETLETGDDGVCNVCRSAEFKSNINWEQRRAQLEELVVRFRGTGPYDCIVPFSGGKDSTYQLHFIINELKMKPLVVRFNHGFLRPTIRDNTERTLKKLGADFIDFTPNWHLVKKLMLESFRRKGDFCWHCHTGIYSFPIRIALAFRVPLIFWGEPQSEITAYYDYANEDVEWEDERKFYLLRTLGITAEDMHSILSPTNPELELRDLLPYTYPNSNEVEELGVCSVPLGSFIPWDYESQSIVIRKELGWQLDELEGIPATLNSHGEKIECFMQGTRDYLKFVKRGYGRAAQIAAFKARKGEISAEQAVKFSEELDGKRPPSLDLFLEYVGLTEEEFREIASDLSIHPYSHDFENEERSDELWDMSAWHRENQ